MERINSNDHKFLSQLSPLIDDCEIYSFGIEHFSRRNSDGLMTLIIKDKNFQYGIIYNDFKVNGGSFGKEVCQRAIKFIEKLDQEKLPLIYLVNSIGVRLMEGRGVFNEAFKLIPSIERFKKNNMFITANLGKSLGLGALILSQGHYRFSLSKNAEINLTGPEVIKLFFGKNIDFNKISSPEKHKKDSSIIQEIYHSKEDLFLQIKNHLTFQKTKPKYSLNKQRVLKNIYKLKTPEERVKSLVMNISDSHKEVFTQLDQSVRTFLIHRNGKLMGVFINPPGHSNNLITISTIEKYSAALTYFGSIKVPIVSFLDTPGASPLNSTNQSKEVINSIRDVSTQIINYKFGKMGFVIGRSYGGATILGLTKNFGAYSQYIIKGSHVGIMHKSIIEKLLDNSKRLFSMWKENQKLEKDDFSDLIENGTIDGLIDYSQVANKLDQFEDYCFGNRVAADFRPNKYLNSNIEIPAIKSGPLKILTKKQIDKTNKQIS